MAVCMRQHTQTAITNPSFYTVDEEKNQIFRFPSINDGNYCRRHRPDPHA